MPINLTKKEKLMLINDPPDSVLQLSLVRNYFININVIITSLHLKTLNFK